MEGMVANFEAVLHLEIFDMISDYVRRRKACRPSQQSTSAASTGSHRNNPILSKYRSRDVYDLTDIDYVTVIDD
jgi:hypothetical protein